MRGRTSNERRAWLGRPRPVSVLGPLLGEAAVVLADAGLGDSVLAQVTSKPYADAGAVELSGASFARGGLDLTSYARPGKLFTANDALIVREVGALTDAAFDELVEAVVRLLRG